MYKPDISNIIDNTIAALITAAIIWLLLWIVSKTKPLTIKVGGVLAKAITKSLPTIGKRAFQALLAAIFLAPLLSAMSDGGPVTAIRAIEISVLTFCVLAILVLTLLDIFRS